MKKLLLVVSLVGFAGGGRSFADCQIYIPSFDLTGPMCTPTNQLVPCRCSEAMQWDPVAEATYYTIQRRQLPNGPTVISGDTRWRNRQAYTDEDGVTHPASIVTAWLFAWDCAGGGCFFPQEGTGYEYSVKACKPNPQGGADLCSNAWSPIVTYAAAPYYCYNNGTKVPCF